MLKIENCFLLGIERPTAFLLKSWALSGPLLSRWFLLLLDIALTCERYTQDDNKSMLHAGWQTHANNTNSRVANPYERSSVPSNDKYVGFRLFSRAQSAGLTFLPSATRDVDERHTAHSAFHVRFKSKYARQFVWIRCSYTNTHCYRNDVLFGLLFIRMLLHLRRSRSLPLFCFVRIVFMLHARHCCASRFLWSHNLFRWSRV